MHHRIHLRDMKSYEERYIQHIQLSHPSSMFYSHLSNDSAQGRILIIIIFFIFVIDLFNFNDRFFLKKKFKLLSLFTICRGGSFIDKCESRGAGGLFIIYGIIIGITNRLSRVFILVARSERCHAAAN